MTRKQWKARRVRKNAFLRQLTADLAYLSAGLAFGVLAMHVIAYFIT